MKPSKETHRNELYFAYGSNMDRAQLEDRVGEVGFVAIGQLHDHKLVFNRKGSYRAGAVASVIATPGEVVFGVVWALAPEQLQKLSIIEDPRAYKRDLKIVSTEDRENLTCNVFVSIPEGDTEPDADYVALLVEAAKKAGLPRQYVSMIESYKPVQPAPNPSRSPVR